MIEHVVVLVLIFVISVIHLFQERKKLLFNVQNVALVIEKYAKNDIDDYCKCGGVKKEILLEDKYPQIHFEKNKC
jgi:hypothetical protein